MAIVRRNASESVDFDVGMMKDADFRRVPMLQPKNF